MESRRVAAPTPNDVPEYIRSMPGLIAHGGLLRAWQHYVCGHCGTAVVGWVVAQAMVDYQRQWLLCPQCGMGSVRNDNTILPPPQTFPNVDGLPERIAGLYGEARMSFESQIYTGCEILCRKILMNVAVDKGAKPDKKFVQYVAYLESNGHVVSSLKNMATVVKDNGNAAAHEIDPPSRERAEYTLKFTRRILDTVYGVEYDFDKYGERASQADAGGG